MCKKATLWPQQNEQYERKTELKVSGRECDDDDDERMCVYQRTTVHTTNNNNDFNMCRSYMGKQTDDALLKHETKAKIILMEICNMHACDD